MKILSKITHFLNNVNFSSINGIDLLINLINVTQNFESLHVGALCYSRFWVKILRIFAVFTYKRETRRCVNDRFGGTMLNLISLCFVWYQAQDQQSRHLEITKAKEELAKKNQEILQLHSLLNETEQLLVCLRAGVWL